MSTCVHLSRVIIALTCALSGVVTANAESAPVPPATVNHYEGAIRLDIDATDLDHKVMRVHQELPVHAGHLVLLYPQWIPGAHNPLGNPALIAGLHMTGNGKPLKWVRDAYNMFAYHLDVPNGVATLSVDFQFITPLQPAEGRVVMTNDMLHLQFALVTLYPAGVKTDAITVKPRIKLPSGWRQASALTIAQQSDDAVLFAPVSLTTLFDSPLMAGNHFRRYDLVQGSGQPIGLDIFAESEANLDASPKVLAAHGAVIDEAAKIFGAPPFSRYEFLFALTDDISGISREHFESTEIVEKPSYLADVLTSSSRAYVAPHEYVHTWIGKYRRPIGEMTANLNEPVENSLLWVYEGQTQYYGQIVGTRAGMRTQEAARDEIALSMAAFIERPGRGWRDLQDTGNDEVIASRRTPRSWPGWQRQRDYYDEGSLLWLGVDARIRQLTGERKSLDDFAALFYAGAAKSLRTPVSFRFEDIVAGLNQVAPFDWATLLRDRLTSNDFEGLSRDLAMTGWRVVFGKTPNQVAMSNAKESGACDAYYSLGFNVAKDDSISSVLWGGPAFKSGLAPGSNIIAVNGHAYKCGELTSAITSAEGKTAPIELIVRRGNRVSVLPIVYSRGLRYPRLERIEGTPDRLASILQSRRQITAIAAPASASSNMPVTAPR